MCEDAGGKEFVVFRHEEDVYILAAAESCRILGFLGRLPFYVACQTECGDCMDLVSQRCLNDGPSGN